MQNPILDPAYFQKNVNRAYLQCGLFDFWTGFFLYIYSCGCNYAISGFKSSPGPIGIIILIPIGLYALRVIKDKHIVPRAGHFESLPVILPRRIVWGLVFLALFPLFCACTAKFWPKAIGFEPWLRWTPLIFGAMIADAYFWGFRHSGLRPYMASAGCAAALGLVFALFPFQKPETGLLWLLGVMGVISAIRGIAALVRFLDNNPVADSISGGGANNE